MKIKATKYYDGLFYGKYKNGYVETFDKEGNKSSVAKNINGDLHPNPFRLNKFAKAVVYFDSSIEYIIKIYDENMVLKETFVNISTLEGKPGLEPDPDTPIPPHKEPPQGWPGKQGDTVVGPPAPPEEVAKWKGDRGTPPYVGFVAQSNVSYTIPPGISEIFISASAGGGSAANHSKYTLVLPVKDTFYKDSRTGFNGTIDMKFPNQQDKIEASVNKMIMDPMGLILLNFMPGSGFSGQCVNRKRISIADTSVEHKLNVFIGVGGKKTRDKLSGSNGSNTLVYLDDKLVLELKGGLAGEQYFPIDDASAKELIDKNDGVFYDNFGFTSSVYLQQIGKQGNQIGMLGTWPNTGDITPLDYQFKYKTKYFRKVGASEVYEDILMSYRALYFRFDMYKWDYYGNYNQSVILGDNNSTKGENSIFGSFITDYDNLQENYEFYQMEKTNVKNQKTQKKGIEINSGMGSGSGGNIFNNFKSRNVEYPDITDSIRMCAYPPNLKDTYTSQTGTTIAYFNEDLMKRKVISFFEQFQANDSYRPGVLDVPTMSGSGNINNQDVWDAINGAKNYLLGQGYRKVISKEEFIDFNNSPDGMNGNDFIGGDGVDGFCKIEYGSIKYNE